MSEINISLATISGKYTVSIIIGCNLRQQLFDFCQYHLDIDMNNIEISINGIDITANEIASYSVQDKIIEAFNVYPLDVDMRQHLLSQRLNPSCFFSISQDRDIIRNKSEYILSKYPLA